MDSEVPATLIGLRGVLRVLEGPGVSPSEVRMHAWDYSQLCREIRAMGVMGAVVGDLETKLPKGEETPGGFVMVAISEETSPGEVAILQEGEVLLYYELEKIEE